MNRKITSIGFSAILACAAIYQLSPVMADPSDAVSQGGQAPSSGAGGSGFAVRIGSGLDQESADSLKQEVINEGFTAAESRPAAGNTHEVVISGLPSRSQAEQMVEQLKGSGFTTNVEIVSEGGSQSAGASGKIYRVKVAEFDTATEATEASKVLLDERFVNVDIVEDNGKHVLMLGTFNREQDARALLGDVNGAGFAFASVVQRDRVQSGSVSARRADLSALPENEQAAARDVLAMAEKVESGAATADEMKQLREKIEQLTENQKAIINQQESNRSQEQNKLQKIYPLNREFDQAIRARNFDRAEKVLAQIQQISPDDIFLPRKRQLLEEQRNGTSAASSQASTAKADPAKVQSAINEARAADAAGNKSEALNKYRAALALDPTNVEARGKIIDLENAPAPVSPAAETTTDNKKLIYGEAGLAALILLLLGWLKMRGRKPVPDSTPSTGVSFHTDSLDPLSGSSYSSDSPAGIESTSLSGAGLLTTPDLSSMGNIHSFGNDEEEEESTPPSQAPVISEPSVQENESVSLEDMTVEATSPAPTETAPPIDDIVSLNFEDDSSITPPPEPAGSAAGSSAMDADLEALLRGTFPGAPQETQPDVNISEEVLTEVTANTGALSEPTIIFAQNFNSDSEGKSPEGWRGEYDYASLTVENISDARHTNALKFEKLEGAGSATYHLTFPNASGKVIAEFDIRCDQKNKFLLGIYFEKDEDFKQSIHTIVHQLDPNSPATLRIQGEGVPYEMGTWSHVRYELDLVNGKIDAYMDGNPVLSGSALSVVPEYINTLSIRDNLATTGTLYLDNIQIAEGSI